jgi:hypothetical protein
MNGIALGEVIAERCLEGEHEGRAVVVTIKLGKPVPHPDDLWICPYLISSPVEERTFYAGGADSIQALYLALHMIGADLRYRYRELKLRWYGRQDLGFPIDLTPESQ